MAGKNMTLPTDAPATLSVRPETMELIEDLSDRVALAQALMQAVGRTHNAAAVAMTNVHTTDELQLATTAEMVARIWGDEAVRDQLQQSAGNAGERFAELADALQRMRSHTHERMAYVAATWSTLPNGQTQSGPNRLLGKLKGDS